jgi:hypothetical protein
VDINPLMIARLICQCASSALSTINRLLQCSIIDGAEKIK